MDAGLPKILPFVIRICHDVGLFLCFVLLKMFFGQPDTDPGGSCTGSRLSV